VEFSLERPVVDFPYYLSTYQAIILPTTYNGNIAKQKDGTGPYKLVEYVPGQRARFVRNPDYWNKPLPYLDGVEVVLGFSTGGQITALLGGAADTSIVTDYTHIQILQGNPQFRISTAQSSSHNGIFLRTDKAPFTDVRVRQALALAIDRPIVIQNLSNGFGVLGNDNIIAPVFPVYTPTPQRAKDIAKAKALLTAAGHPKGFSTSILTASDSALGTLAPLGIVAQQMFATIGVDAPLRTEPSSIYYNTDWLTAPVTITDWAHRPTPSQFISVAYRSGAVWNASHWSNSQFDKLATQLDATLDLSKRKTIAHQIELLQTAQTPSLLTFFEKIGRPVSVKLEGVFADPANNLDLSRAYFVK
jgi:peptide/nickel transport system substrate-binding protein